MYNNKICIIALSGCPFGPYGKNSMDIIARRVRDFKRVMAYHTYPVIAQKEISEHLSKMKIPTGSIPIILHSGKDKDDVFQLLKAAQLLMAENGYTEAVFVAYKPCLKRIKATAKKLGILESDSQHGAEFHLSKPLPKAWQQFFSWEKALLLQLYEFFAFEMYWQKGYV